MRHLTTLVVMISALLAGCATAPPQSTDNGLSGTWGEDPEDCQSNPHTISFSPQGDVMHVRYPEGGTADGKSLQEHFAYRVLGRSSSALQLTLIGESRTDSSGQPVTWELRQPDKDRYCWWRSDWPANGCTVPRIRCGP